MNILINPYRRGSKSARSLRDGLRGAGIQTYCFLNNHLGNYLLVNWGSTLCPQHFPMLNKPGCVAKAVSKVDTFKALRIANVRTVPALHSKLGAMHYLSCVPDGVVYCRTLTTASAGKGIVVATEPDEVVEAPLYTIGIDDLDRKEYRVHVFNGKVMHTQEKRRREGYADNNKFSDAVRNLAGGWIFAIRDVTPSEGVKTTSINAIAALGLDFGAVDILQTSDGRGWVLEVNTACGLEGTTVGKYVDAIKEYMLEVL